MKVEKTAYCLGRWKHTSGNQIMSRAPYIQKSDNTELAQYKNFIPVK